MLSDYGCWRIHKAVVAHFTSKKYDIFEYRGRTTADSEEHFKKSRAKGIFKIVAREVASVREATEFFLANIIYTGEDQIFEIDVAKDRYIRWLKEKESLTFFMSEQISNLPGDCMDGNPPKLFEMLVRGGVSPQTVFALDRELHFLHSWEKNYFGIGNYPTVISKLGKFLRYNDTKLKKVISEKFDNETISV